MRKTGILSYDNFDTFLQNVLVKNSSSKFGSKKELAEFINIHPTSLSQVLNNTRTFTDEQVFLLGEFLNFNEVENQYVLILHQIANTQNKLYKSRLIKRRDSLKKKSLNLSNHLSKDKILTEEQKSLFYSTWYYTCTWVFVSIEGGKTKEEIIERFSLERKVVLEVLDFLIKSDLGYLENGKYHHKMNRTHLEKSSPQLKQHHSNWRIKAIQNMDQINQNNLSFTAPLSLSQKDFEWQREEMVLLIKRVSDTVKETNPEEIFCFCMDFLKFNRGPQYIMKTKSVLFGAYKEVSVQVTDHAGRIKSIK